MNQRINFQFAGLAGILSALLYLLSIIGLQNYIAADLTDVDAFTRNMADSHGMMLLYGWPGLFATLLIIPLVLVLLPAEKTNRFPSQSLFLITMLGLGFILVGYLFHLALTYFYAPAFQELDASGQTSFGVVFQTTVGLQDMFWLSGDLLAFLGIGALMLANMNRQLIPKWLLVFGVLASLLAATGSVSFIPAFKKVPGLSFLFIGGFALFTVWEILVGVRLLRRSHLTRSEQ